MLRIVGGQHLAYPLARDVVKMRAEALQVGATPEGVAALDALIAQSRTLLPPAGKNTAKHLARDPSPTQAAPDLGDEEPAVDAGQPLRARPADGGRAPTKRSGVVSDGGVRP